MGMALPRRLALQAWANRRRGFDDLRVGHVAARSTAAIAGVDELDGAHRRAQCQCAHLEPALGIGGSADPASPGDHSCRPERSVRCAVAQNRPSASAVEQSRAVSQTTILCARTTSATGAAGARTTPKTAIIGRPQQRSAVRCPNVSMISAAVTCGESRNRCSAISPARACHQPVTRPAIRWRQCVQKARLRAPPAGHPQNTLSARHASTSASL